MSLLLVNKEQYEAMKKKLKELEEDSPEGVVTRAMNIMRLAGKTAEQDPDYQDVMKRLYLAQVGKLDPTMNAYSKTAFIKDNPEEILARLEEMKQGLVSAGKTKRLEDKTRKK